MLLCVRYRYDEIRQVRMKTVEIIVEERPCTPLLRYRDQDIVAVMVPYTQKNFSGQVEGGRRMMGPGGKALAGAVWFHPWRC